MIPDGKIHRFSPGRKGNPDGWYVFYGMAGAFGDWKQGIHQTWSVPKDSSSPYQEELQAQMRQVKEKAIEEGLRKQEEVAQEAASHWESLSETGSSPYLDHKKIGVFGIRFSGDTVVIPIRDRTGKLWSLQTISPDGTKRFLFGGRKKGCFHLIGQPHPKHPLYLTEGYATGASIHMATGDPVAVAFDAGNLGAVMNKLSAAYPQTPLVLAGDDDVGKMPNVGRKTAEDIGRKYSCSVVFPVFKAPNAKLTDFNDLHVNEGLEEIKRQLGVVESSVGWANPSPLSAIKKDLLPVPEFPAALIPDPYQAWLCDVADRMQCPLDYVAVGSLIVTASLIGAGCGIRPKAKDSWTVIPNLWGGLIGPPSTLKSPALKEILKPLEALEKQAYEDYESAQRSYCLDLEVSKALHDAIKKDMIKAAGRSDTFALEEAKERLRKIQSPEEPTCKRYVTNDTTIEKLHELLSRNPRGLLLFRDELMGLLSQWEKHGHEGDRAFYLEAWNGYGSKTTDRIGRGTLHTKTLCLSLLGSTQPSKLTTYFEKFLNGGENDGLLQRFQVLIYPDLSPLWKLVDQHPNDKARLQASAVMQKLAFMDFKKYGALEEPSSEIPFYHFDPQAQEVFYEWLTDLEGKLRNHQDEPILIEHLAKYRKLMPSLALIFHLLEVATEETPGAVSVRCAEKAAAWCDYLEAHARRIYDAGISITWQAARNLAKRILQRELSSPFDLREVYRKQWSLLRTREEVEPACDILLKKGWLQERIISEGGRPKKTYLINPHTLSGKLP